MISEERQQNLIHSFLIVTILMGVFWFLGYVVTLVTRLFMRPFRFPGLIQGGIIGFAAFWLLIMISPEKPHLAKPLPELRKSESIHEEGADCIIKDNKVCFNYVPKKQPEIHWESHVIDRDERPIHLIRDAGDPKVYHPSSDPQKIIPEDMGWDGDKVFIQIKNDLTERTAVIGETEKPKHRLTPQQKRQATRVGWWFSACIYILGIIMLLAAHGEAFNDNG